MKPPLLHISLVLLLACQPQNSASPDPFPSAESEVGTEIIRDTVTVMERIIDTVFIEKENTYWQSEFYLSYALPQWLKASPLLQGKTFAEKYVLDPRLNPMYLEADFNGDGTVDIALLIKNIATEDVGFAVVHGGTHEVFILGAGQESTPGFSSNPTYIDVWRINRERKNEPGLTEEEPLILENPSLEIKKSEVGGGLLYWDGAQYAYFHQTC
ncbi:MAG TPA: hypothetical protein DCE41_32740 [Cytophagales bacterium]|nr:hypothetical protein [Cytophagales bacterium]HAA21898.1 hypothetical protein [Cytophagales bacterium]HAP64196.1 hypothetical protein [Cytophagales bacterium]